MFTLDSRLDQDCFQLGDFRLNRLLLMNDARYPWFILVPRREDVTEVFQLSENDQSQLWREVSWLSEMLKDAVSADKMNIATLGNVVSQLHIHVIARRKVDAAWPGPVWGHSPAEPYSQEQLADLKRRLKALLDDEEFTFLETV